MTLLEAQRLSVMLDVVETYLAASSSTPNIEHARERVRDVKREIGRMVSQYKREKAHE